MPQPAARQADACDLLGCDFSSSPSSNKQIVLAWGRLTGQVVRLGALERYRSLADWQARLGTGQWVGAFDLPFGLPRELVQSQHWPLDWEACVRHFASCARSDLRTQLKAFCDARPAGRKFAHRQTDGPAGSSPSMKWVNPPVAWMLHAGVTRLLDVGATFPAHQLLSREGQIGAVCDGAAATVALGSVERVALEGYPGLLARELTGGSVSYKSDDRKRQTPERLLVRKNIVTALEQGRSRLGVRLKLSPAQADVLVADATGDNLDAVLCLVQAAWASHMRATGHHNWGLPPDVDSLEGWILTA